MRRAPILILVSLLALCTWAQAQAPAAVKYRISGTVVDSASGAPIPEAEVSLTLPQAETMFTSTVAGPDGRFSIEGLTAGKYGLMASAHGYQLQGYERHGLYFTAIVTGPGLESENLVFRLKADASVSGTITDEFNDPVPDAEITLLAVGLPDAPQAVLPRFSGNTDDAGQFHLGHLSEGKYYLVVRAHPWYAQGGPPVITESAEPEPPEQPVTQEPTDEDSSAKLEHMGGLQHPPVGNRESRSPLDVAFPTTYYPNATDAALATPIVLKPGEHATADMQLFSVPALHLKVRGTTTPANEFIGVTLAELVFGYPRQVASGGLSPNGTEFKALAPGKYVLEARLDKGMPEQQPVDLVADTEVGIGEGGKSVSTVSATVQVEGGGSCAHCVFELVNRVSREQIVTYPREQGFEANGSVRPGSYVVTLLYGEGYDIKSISAAGAKMVGTDVVIPAGAAVKLNIVLTKGIATINGIALRDGKAASQTAVILVPNDPAHNLSLFRRDQSDSDGTFSLLRVLPGDYTVIAISEGWDLDWTNPAVLKPYLAGGVKVRVPGEGKYQVKVGVQSVIP